MFNNISWQGYWITIALLTAAYYLIIYLLYYRKDFSIAWKRNPNTKESPFFSVVADTTTPLATGEQPSGFDNPEEFQLPEKNSIESVVYACIDEVNAYLEEAKRGKCVKEEMLYALQSILRKFPVIAESEYKASVTNVLVTQCEYYCSVHLNADDVAKVWVEG
jgi:hypothetical protein